MTWSVCRGWGWGWEGLTSDLEWGLGGGEESDSSHSKSLLFGNIWRGERASCCPFTVTF